MLVNAVDRLALWTGLVVRWVLVAITALMFLEVVRRYIFSNPSGWSYDVTIMLGAVFFLFAACYTLVLDGHIRIDLIYGRFSIRWQQMMDAVFGCILLVPALVVLVVRGWAFAFWSVEVAEVSAYSYFDLPMWPLRYLLAIGFTILLLETLAAIVRQFVSTRRGHKVLPAFAKEGDE